jgi:hypothetical protein
VYQSSLEPLLTTYLEGYDVCVLLYGAANTGKTHTLVGPDTGPALGEQQFGLIPRLVRWARSQGFMSCIRSGAFSACWTKPWTPGLLWRSPL